MAKLDEHIAKSDYRFGRLEGKIDTVMTNHLPHLKADTEVLDERTKHHGKLLWLIIGLIIAVNGITLFI